MTTKTTKRKPVTKRAVSTKPKRSTAVEVVDNFGLTDKQRNATAQRAGESLWRDGFIVALSRHGNVTAACDSVGINRTTAYRAYKADAEFAVKWDDALLEAADRIEYEALRRAKRGVLKPVYYQGKRVGYEREYSDTLMGMMLKGHKPEKYSDRLIIKATPEQAALLKATGLSVAAAWDFIVSVAEKLHEKSLPASDIFEAMIQELSETPENVDSERLNGV